MNRALESVLQWSIRGADTENRCGEDRGERPRCQVAGGLVHGTDLSTNVTPFPGGRILLRVFRNTARINILVKNVRRGLFGRAVFQQPVGHVREHDRKLRELLLAEWLEHVICGGLPPGRAPDAHRETVVIGGTQ